MACGASSSCLLELVLELILNNYNDLLQHYGFTSVALPTQLKHPIGGDLSALTRTVKLKELRKLKTKFGLLTELDSLQKAHRTRLDTVSPLK